MTIIKDHSKVKPEVVQKLRGQLLTWYDRHARILPWRARKGKKTDPYHVWLSEIMLQQTTVAAVQPYFNKFIDLWPSVNDLAKANSQEVMRHWAGLGYYARARNLHACAQKVANDLGGIFPKDEKTLLTLPGVGPYTAAAIRAIAFNLPACVVDGNVERVMARVFDVHDPLPHSKPYLKKLAGFVFEEFKARPGDLAQAVMDLGAVVCIPKTPRCGLCPLQSICEGHKNNNASSLPKKISKTQKPKKFGHVYWIENTKGQILLQRRPPRGLLGGMMGLPTSEWHDHKQVPQHLPFIRNIKSLDLSIHHVFTHFDLELSLSKARIKKDDLGDDYQWHEIAEAQDLGLPSVFQKAYRLFV